MSIATIAFTKNTTATTVADPAPVEAPKGLPAWYFAMVGVSVGGCDVAQGYPSLWAYLIPLVVVNVVVSFTVMRARMKFFKAMMRNSHTRMLALALVAIRFGLRLLIHLVGFELAAQTGHVVVGVVMGLFATFGAMTDQWLIIRALNRANAKTAARVAG
ncbi:hypothetical protein B4N89_17765 [Embleya scabrispora]|uniref:Uncharacterized protein n=1 Tax=Embleya scabrispora TaxID=159449 RepID=A0A1T3P0A5_9ACTN|nr:hypothetical protein [Embleya scabrispora]OPC82538.1 hypothetical protein B4N89_17765 [Embleya scabrispora]